MGKLFYQNPKWKSKDTVYFVQIHLDYSFHLILKVVTFTKDTGDSGGYVFDKSTGNFRRALKTDKGTKYIKKNKNTKSTVPFLNIENMEKFEASKMGVLKQFVEDVRTYLRDYIEINFETMEEMMSHDKYPYGKPQTDEVARGSGNREYGCRRLREKLPNFSGVSFFRAGNSSNRVNAFHICVYVHRCAVPRYIALQHP